MRAKIVALRKGIANMFNNKKYTTQPSLECDAHMNELPVPCQPWGPWYERQQSFYNKHLFFGFAWWLLSLGLAVYTDSFLLEFWGPPRQPGPPSDMVDECDEED